MLVTAQRHPGATSQRQQHAEQLGVQRKGTGHLKHRELGSRGCSFPLPSTTRSHLTHLAPLAGTDLKKPPPGAGSFPSRNSSAVAPA